MLVLTRKVGQIIRIGGGIKIVVTRIGKDDVQLGIEAPLDVPIHRQEVWDAVFPADATLGNPKFDDPK